MTHITTPPPPNLLPEFTIHLLLSDTDPKIRFVELVGRVPPQGTKLTPLLDQGMEEA